MSRRIVILPFDTKNVHLQYFVESIQDLLIEELNRSRTFTVISKESAKIAFESSKNIQGIPKQLDVFELIHGSIEEEDTINIKICHYQLNPEHVETRGFSISHTNIFAIGEKCKEMMLGFLGIQNEVSASLGHYRSIQPNSYQKLILGNYHFNRWTQDNVAEAIDLYQNVIEHEPDYASAYLKLAKCFIFQAGRGYAKPNNVYPRAREAVEKAWDLQPHSGEAIIYKNLIDFFYDLDWRNVYKSIEKGLANHVDASEAYQQLSFFWYGLKEYDAALDALYSALEYDPISTGILNMIGDVQLSAKRYDSSEKTFLSILKMVPNDAASLENLLYIAALRGNRSKCLFYLGKLRKILPREERFVPRMAYAFGKFGMEEEARAYLDYYDTLEKLKPYRVLHNFKAQVYSGLGDWEKVMDCIEKGWKARTGILYILTDPQFEPIRKWKRYRNLISEIQLPKKAEDIHYISLTTDIKKSIRVNLKALLFIKAEDNYTRLYFFQNFRVEEKLVRATLKTIGRQLPQNFIRVHKTYILNIDVPFQVFGNSKTRFITHTQHDFEITVSRGLDKTILKFLLEKSQ
ncbi:tetratricopeptide repeat protein [Aquimarina sp. 2304DJ70-9]|uniref:tetratricopeptide repeat protein n=1 Tax=Aquimarina penaris TaxID=3231044 RepID=UPI003462CC39